MSCFGQDELLESRSLRYEDVDSDRLLCASGKEETVQRGDLLEDYRPKIESMTSTSSFDSAEAEDEAEDNAASASVSITEQRRQLRVDFSETSQLYVLKRESSSLLRSLSYTEKDYENFGREAILEGLRIKDIIATTPHDSTAKSIKYLLKHGIISKEELLGIEHFVLGKPSSVPKMRRLHAAAVLWKQQELQLQQVQDPLLGLAKFAQSSSLSLRTTQSARIRAGRAA